jgi:hypothetical protein
MKLRAGRVILFSSLLGIAGGVALSFREAGKVERERERLDAKVAKAQKPQVRPKTYELAGKVTYVDPEAVKYLPEYPKAVVTDLAEHTSAQGVPMKAGMFMTTDKLENVLEWYRAELDKAGWLTVTQSWGDGAAYVGFYGPDKHMHTVALMRSGSQTLVFLANSDPEAFLSSSAQAQRPQALPAAPQVRGELSFKFGDDGMSRQTYVAKADAMSLAQARDFYKDGLTKLGWRVVATDEEQPGRVRLEAKRGAEDLSLTLSRDDNQGHVAVYAHLFAHR